MISILDIPPGETAVMIAGGHFSRVQTDVETVLNMKQQSIVRAYPSRGVLELSTGAKIKVIKPDPEHLKGLRPRTLFVFRDTIKRGEESAYISDMLRFLREEKGFKIQTFDEEWWPIDKALRRKFKEQQRKERE